MLEDNLVARVYTSYETEGHFLAFYTVLNCYVYLLAYVYSPTSAQAKDNTHVMRDNPAFSMINESDEETEAMLQPEQDSQQDKRQQQPALVNLGHDDDSDWNKLIFVLSMEIWDVFMILRFWSIFLLSYHLTLDIY